MRRYASRRPGSALVRTAITPVPVRVTEPDGFATGNRAMADLDSAPLMGCRAERFDEWFRYPLSGAPSDPRVEVRRAHPSEFERIYDLVDEAFGVQRPRALYDWLYRRNPHGVARCWIVAERASSRFVANLTTVPWPLARGTRVLAATVHSDYVIAPGWQGQGLNDLRHQVRESHPLEWTSAVIGWPNLKSRGSLRKGGLGDRVVGLVPCRALPLHAARELTRRGWPWLLATAAERTAHTIVAAWTTILLARPFGGTVEPVRRFEARYDLVTERCMMWDGYWCPHNADFLNWRYFDHPTHNYLACAAVIRDAVAGYCVVRIDGERAWLMDFAAPQQPASVARALLLRAITAAREAGCGWLAICAPPRWRHWPLVRSAGFVKIPLDISLYTLARDEPDVQQLENWQFLAGDIDGL